MPSLGAEEAGSGAKLRVSVTWSNLLKLVAALASGLVGVPVARRAGAIVSQWHLAGACESVSSHAGAVSLLPFGKGDGLRQRATSFVLCCLAAPRVATGEDSDREDGGGLVDEVDRDGRRFGTAPRWFA